MSEANTMNTQIANDLIRYAELVEDCALISPEEMNCASLMRLAAEALAQPEQDADRFCDANCTWSDHHPNCKYGKPEQRTWVDLTDEQMWNAYTGGSDIINLDYAKSIVALFKEKNT